MRVVVKIVVSLAVAASAALAADTGLIERGADLAARNVNRAAAAVWQALGQVELRVQARSSADLQAETEHTRAEGRGSVQAQAQGEAAASGELNARPAWRWLLQALPGVSASAGAQGSDGLTVQELLGLD